MSEEQEQMEEHIEQVAPVDVEVQEEKVEAPEAEEPEGVIVTIGDELAEEQEQAAAPEWVRDLRKQNREDKRRIRELEEQVKRQAAPASTDVPKLGPKPTFDNPTGNPGDAYDAEKFAAAMEAWHEQRIKVAEHEAKQRAEVENQQKAWQARLSGYETAKANLKAPDYEDAEGAVMEALSTTQQGVILQGSDNPALVVYALGKNPTKAKDLAAIKDPIAFAFAVAKLETQLKVGSRKAPPQPEKTVVASTGGAVSQDAQLERLQAEADRTGDRTKVARYLREKAAR